MELLVAYAESRDLSAANKAIAMVTAEIANNIRKIQRDENANPRLRTRMALTDEFQIDLAFSTLRSLDNDFRRVFGQLRHVGGNCGGWHQPAAARCVAPTYR
jgi:hypothetical protein